MPHTSLEKPREVLADSVLQLSALHAACPIVLALEACHPDLRAEAITLFKQLHSGNLDEAERFATVALLVEILFPDTERNELSESQPQAAALLEEELRPDAREVWDRMRRDEVQFAERLRQIMNQKGVTQEGLAEKIGVGQSAISMMLQRQCRPQKRTIQRLAEALDVHPEELWPTHSAS